MADEPLKYSLEDFDTKNRVLCVLTKLMKRRCNKAFLRPVDPNNDGCSDYFDVVKSPMDLGSIDRLLEDGSIKTLYEFVNHVRLVFNNCMLYNMDDSSLHRTAKVELDRFEDEMSAHLLNVSGFMTDKPSADSTLTKRSRMSRPRKSSPDFTDTDLFEDSDTSEAAEAGNKRGRDAPGLQINRPSDKKAARCIHGKIKYACPDPACGTGSLLCLHGRHKRHCKDPACAAACRAGAAFCEHGKQRKYC